MLALFPLTSFATPFGLDLKKRHERPPALKGYRVWSGSVFSRVVYLKVPESESGVEAEVHLHFSSKRVTKVIIIFGPRGIDNGTCISLYKEVNTELQKRYGPHKKVLQIKDPIIDDLVLGTPCTHVSMGAYLVETHWSLKKMKIVSYLFGDDEGFYIEVQYVFPGHLSKKRDLFKDL